jgi:hypothetical protein
MSSPDLKRQLRGSFPDPLKIPNHGIPDDIRLIELRSAQANCHKDPFDPLEDFGKSS